MQAIRLDGTSVLSTSFSVKPKLKEREKNRMTENDKIRDLENASRNARHLVDGINEAHYDLTVVQLVKTVQNLAEVMIRILEKYEGQ